MFGYCERLVLNAVFGPFNFFDCVLVDLRITV
jgi:hypothetical protein